MSVATACAVLRVRLARTISRALPRITAAMAHAQPTLPAPTIPIFILALRLAAPRESTTYRRYSSAVLGCAMHRQATNQENWHQQRNHSQIGIRNGAAYRPQEQTDCNRQESCEFLPGL